MAWRARLGDDEKHLMRLAEMAKATGGPGPIALEDKPETEPLSEVVLNVWRRLNALRDFDGMVGPKGLTVEAICKMLEKHRIPEDDHAFYIDCMIVIESEQAKAKSEAKTKSDG